AGGGAVDGGDAGVDAGIGGGSHRLSAGGGIVDGDGDVAALGGDASEGASDKDARDVLGVYNRRRDPRGAVEEFLGSKLGLLGDALDAGKSRGDLGLICLDGDDVVDAG